LDLEEGSIPAVVLKGHESHEDLSVQTAIRPEFRTCCLLNKKPRALTVHKAIVLIDCHVVY